MTGLQLAVRKEYPASEIALDLAYHLAYGTAVAGAHAALDC